MKFSMSNHAVQRYHERVKPGLSLQQARDELEVLLRMAEGPHSRPDWHPPADSDGQELYLTLADGIVAVLSGGLIVTVLTRGGHSSVVRTAKNARRARRRARRKKLPYRPGMGKEAGIKWR